MFPDQVYKVDSKAEHDEDEREKEAEMETFMVSEEVILLACFSATGGHCNW